jgi:hypothetical protein
LERLDDLAGSVLNGTVLAMVERLLRIAIG